MDAALWKLTDGLTERHKGSAGKWSGFEAPRALAHAIDLGPLRPSWYAARGRIKVGPASIEGAGLSDGRAGLVEAKMVATAMVTGDITPLVVRAHLEEDCTEDVVFAIEGMLRLIVAAPDEEPTEIEEGTEAAEVTEESSAVVARSGDWRVVSLLRGLALQRHVPEYRQSFPHYPSGGNVDGGFVGPLWESYGLFHELEEAVEVARLHDPEADLSAHRFARQSPLI